ncbi:MAG: hypothetical protein CVU29_11565 [Betaproteobacteria bacterium HGW-Betaproteobacteria-22]|nr:MAG: hypothetical protein CVU29_11565 [Betaproteobacteria bacterium HGW-Betaproteobacteria-22]
MPLTNLLLRDEAQEAAERITQAYQIDRLGVSDNAVAVKANMSTASVKQSGRNQHTMERFALKINL